MGTRLELHEILVTILGTRNVYFQPPEGRLMEYPCIVYRRDKIDSAFADNLPYRHYKRYQVTVIDPDVDSEIPDKISRLSRSVHDRQFTSDNLYHDVFNLYF